MKNLSIFILVFSLIFMEFASAQDDLEDIGADGTPVTTRLINGITVTISTQGGFQLTARTYNASTFVAFNGANNQTNAPLNPGNVSGTRFISNVADTVNLSQAQPVIFEFSQSITLFGLTTLDLLEEGDVGSTLKLQAFDQANILIAEQSRSGPQGPSGLDLDWTVSAS